MAKVLFFLALCGFTLWGCGGVTLDGDPEPSTVTPAEANAGPYFRSSFSSNCTDWREGNPLSWAIEEINLALPRLGLSVALVESERADLMCVRAIDYESERPLTVEGSTIFVHYYDSKAINRAMMERVAAIVFGEGHADPPALIDDQWSADYVGQFCISENDLAFMCDRAPELCDGSEAATCLTTE